MDVEIINHLLSYLVILALVLILGVLVYLILFRAAKNSWLRRLFEDWGARLAFFIALLATLGSLFYSNIAGFAPCELCWYQRIFMYPQVILLGLAWFKKEKRIIDYSLILAGLGFLIALYHNYLTWGGATTTVCATASFVGVSCLRRYVFEFGFITIPFMSLSAFALIILILAAGKRALAAKSYEAKN